MAGACGYWNMYSAAVSGFMDELECGRDVSVVNRIINYVQPVFIRRKNSACNRSIIRNRQSYGRGMLKNGS